MERLYIVFLLIVFVVASSLSLVYMHTDRDEGLKEHASWLAALSISAGVVYAIYWSYQLYASNASSSVPFGSEGPSDRGVFSWWLGEILAATMLVVSGSLILYDDASDSKSRVVTDVGRGAAIAATSLSGILLALGTLTWMTNAPKRAP